MALKNNKQMAIAAEGTEMAGYNVKAYKSNFLQDICNGKLFTNYGFFREIGSWISSSYLYSRCIRGVGAKYILTTVDGMPIFKSMLSFRAWT